MRIGSDWTCSGFEVVEHPGARVLSRSSAVPWVRYVLEGGQGLHAASERDKDAQTMEGREPVYVIPVKLSKERDSESGDRWAVRHYTRGGRLVSKLLGDRYLRWGRVRPYHETAASEAARTRGIPTPRVVAAAMYPEGAFYRADLVTDFVPDSSDLVETLFDDRRKGPGGAGERLDALRATGELIWKLASVGIRHRDLHARNILLEWQGAAPTAHLLDLDRCEVGREGTQISPVSMHQRLRRSLLKWTHGTGIRLSEREWDALERATAG